MFQTLTIIDPRLESGQSQGRPHQPMGERPPCLLAEPQPLTATSGRVEVRPWSSAQHWPSTLPPPDNGDMQHWSQPWSLCNPGCDIPWWWWWPRCQEVCDWLSPWPASVTAALCSRDNLCPRAQCTAALPLQSLKLQSNGIFITRTWHSELDVWGKLLYSITYICHRLNPQPEDRSQGSVLILSMCLFWPEYSLYTCWQKRQHSFANVIVGMTCEGSHESVFCVLGTAVLVSAVSDAAYLQAVSCCRFCRFPALSHHCTEPRQRSDKRQATNSVLTHLHGPVLSRNQGGLKKSSNRIFWWDQLLDNRQSKGGN